MVIEFGAQYLEDLYYEGRTNDKHHRLPPAVIKKYIRVVDTLEAVTRIEDLFRYNSLNYEALLGNMQGKESVRIDNKYRLIIESRIEDSRTTITACRLIDITNHYQ